METRLEELLEQMHKLMFGDADQIVKEIAKITLDQELTVPQLAFCSSKLLNSSVSLFAFLKKYSQDKDKLLTSTKKRICEFVQDYMKDKFAHVVDYLPHIYESCLLAFISDASALVKEAALGPIKRMVELYDAKEVETIIKPAKLTNTLLDEIKVKRPSASVKGSIWELIGSMLKKYKVQLEDYRFEIQDVMFNQLCEQMKSSRPEIRNILGIFKGYIHALDEVMLRPEQVNKLYSLIKIAMVPVDEGRAYTVVKAAIKLLTSRSQLFKPQIIEDALPLCEKVLELCAHENMEIRESANELLEEITKRFTEGLKEGKAHKDIFKHLIGRYHDIIESPERTRSALVITVIRTMGILSMATKTFMGEPILKSILSRLIEISDARVIIDMAVDKDTTMSNFKVVLAKQKMLISFMTSYSYIVQQLSQCPSENAMTHFYKLVMAAIRNYPKFYEKYKPSLHQALANLFMSLSYHKFQFIFWSKKLLSEGLLVSLKIPESVIMGDEPANISLNQAVALWENWLKQPTIWSESTCKGVYDQVVDCILRSATDLQLQYNVSIDPNTSTTSYVPAKSEDLQFFIRVVNFAQKLLPKLEVSWFIPWIPMFASELTTRLYELPRISKLYSLLKVALQLGDSLRYFNITEKQRLPDQCSTGTFNLLNAFFKHLAVRQNEFEDELLSFSLELLLAVPIPFIYSPAENSLHIYVPLMVKALTMGVIDTALAYNAVDCLEKWISQIPIKSLRPYMKSILPHLSPYLVLSSEKQQSPQAENNEVTQLLMRQTEVHSSAQISKRVLELLGNLGGECHDVVGDKQISQAAMAWDLDRIIKFPVPLLNRKIDVFLDSVLPRIIELTKTTVNWETRTAAIELLHAVVVYVIGKSNELQETTSFSKIFQKLIPEMLRLASDIQQVPRSIFEPLCKQTVHWLATSVKQEKGEVAALLDSLLEGAADKSNATLREHCAVCIAEYFDWHARHIPKAELSNNPITIKSLIRKIQSFAIHPDPFKQLASVLCFDKLFRFLRNEQALVDLYVMDITISLLAALRLAEASLCETTARHLVDMIDKTIRHFRPTLSQSNEKRLGQKSFAEFADRLFEKVSASEELCRLSAQQLWVATVENPATWLVMRISKLRAQGKEEDKKSASSSSILHFPLVDHVTYTQAQAATYMKAEKMNEEKFGAQVQFVAWLLKGSFAKWTELPAIFGRKEVENFGLNIKNFLELLLSYADTGAKELRNPIIRLKITGFSNVLELFGILQPEELAHYLRSVLEITPDSFLDMLLIAATNPQALDLELCATDKPLLARLNGLIQSSLGKLVTLLNPSDKSGAFLLRRLTVLYSDGKITNICNKEGIKQLISMPTERLIQLCLGHLGIYRQIFKSHENKYVILGETDPLTEYFKEQKEAMIKLVEELVEESNPTNVQKVKVILKYVLHLGVPYEKVEKWLLENFTLFQHCSDILFDYIVGCWDEGMGQSIIRACEAKKTMLPVLFPVLNRLISGSERPGFLRVLYEAIPEFWKVVSEDVDAIVNELKIYQIIIGFARTRLLNDLQSHIGEKLLTHCTERIKEYLKDSYSVIVKKEALLLGAEVWGLKIGKVQAVSAMISPSLKQLQRKHFPIKTSDLEKGSKEAINFEIVLDAFVRIFSINLSWESLQWLFLILRETASPYLHKIKASLAAYVQKLLHASYETFISEVSAIYKCFADPDTDSNIYDNLRWAIARRLLIPLLEKCEEKFLIEFIKSHHATLETTLKDSSKDDSKTKAPNDICLDLYYKGYTYQIYEVLYRRIDADTIKSDLHKHLYGASSQGNELTKFLIMSCHNAKRQPAAGYKELDSWLQSQAATKRSIGASTVEFKGLAAHTVQEFYSSSAYGCMCSVITKTQSKEILYNQYLFQINRDKGDMLWELMLDTESKQQFEIETAFQVKLLSGKAEEKSVPAGEVTESFQRYFTDSLFVQSSVIPTHQVVSVQPKKVETSPATEAQATTYEEDSINKQEAMKHVLRLLSTMEKKFEKEWQTQGMPQFMQALRYELIRPETHINVKLFILKMIMNKPKLFKPHAKEWFDPIMSYLIDCKEQGKGFHYFSRDLCTTILEWEYRPYAERRAMELCSSLVNNIIKVLPDKTSYIFHMNVRVLGALIERFAPLIFINKPVLISMVSMDEKKDASDLWRLNAMQILAFASTNNIPLADSLDQYLSLPAPKSFQTSESDPLYKKLLDNLTFHKKTVALAAADTMGRIHKRMKSKALDEAMVISLVTLVANKNAGTLAQVCERVAANYPEIFGERKLFVKLLGLMQTLSGSFRKNVLSAISYYLPVCRANNNAGDITEICVNMQANAKALVLDNLDEHKTSVLTLLMGLLQVDLDAVNSLCAVILPLIQCDAYVRHNEESIRLLVIQIMSKVYDTMPKLKKFARVAIAKGFSDKSQKVQEYLYNIWDTEDRLRNDPGNRLIAIMRDLYAGDGDTGNWVSMSLGLLLGLSRRSSDYSRKIYEQPLSKCAFNKLNIYRNNILFNRSQPLTLLSSSLSDSQGNSSKLAAELIEGAAKEDKKEELGDKEEPAGGIRATQSGIFTQTMEQSLVLGKAEPPMFGDSFYQIEGRGKSNNLPPNQYRNDMMEDDKDGHSREKSKNGKDGFKVPEMAGPQYRKAKKHLSKFFATGSFIYGPQMVEGKIRYNPLGATASAKMGTQREEQESKWRARMQQQSAQRGMANVCREYRVGELPDIEILYKDIIEPLRILALKDASIASELFVSLFAGVYFTEGSEDIRAQLCHYLGELIQQQKRHSASYQTVYTLHQVFIRLVKEGVDVPLAEAQFSSSEQNALSFQTSILAIEHAILGIHKKGVQPKEKRGKDEPPAGPRRRRAEITSPGVNESNRHLWLQLAKLYKQINYADYTAGIYAIISSDVSAYVVHPDGEELPGVLSNILTSRLNAKHSRCVELTQALFASPEQAQAVHQDLIKSLRKERYESLACLSQWEDLEGELCLGDEEWLWNAENQEELSCLLRSRVRCEKTWEKQTKDMERWLQDPSKKEVLLKQFSYELALHSIIQQDLDRAIYYVDRELTKVQQKWSNINSMSFVTMHYLVQYLQKIHEFYECLNLLKRENIDPREKIVEQAVKLCNKWKDRVGNVHFDSIHTWDDILHARCLFLDIMYTKFAELRPKLNASEEVRDLVAHFYTQAAHAGYKKKLFECTDKYLRLALKHRVDPTTTSLSLTYPIIKLKAKQHQIEGIALEPVERINKYLKIIEIANGENAKVQGRSVHLLLLSAKLSQIVAKEYVNGGWLDEYSKCVSTCFELLQRASTQVDSAEGEADRKQKAKVHFNYANFCDSILRQLDSEIKECIGTQLGKIKVSPNDLAVSVIHHGFASINTGHEKGTYLIPRMLEILSQQHSASKDVARTFAKESALTPAWIFLPWINQLIAILDEPASEAISAKFIEMVEKYPQPIIYAFKVAQSNKDIDLLRMEGSGHSFLYDNVVSMFESNLSTNAWVEALDCLVNPEHRMKYWLELIKEVFPNDAMKDADRLRRYVTMCYYDVFTMEKKYVGKLIGTYNRKFVQIFEKTLSGIFGKDGSRVDKLDFASFATSMNAVLKKLSELIGQLGEGHQKLSAFSEWLDEYNSNDVKDLKDLIEIPGQYKRNIEPCPERHVKMASVNKTILILGSIRRPKRIEVHGTNEKSYYMLVKGGEDLRLDERIQQLFSLMNEIFVTDTDCKSRSIRIKQFNVTPMTNRLGIAKWVNNTIPLKQLIQKQLAAQGIQDIRRSPAHAERLKWMNQICPNKAVVEQHLRLLSVDAPTITEAFRAHVEATPWYLLRKSVEDMCLSPEAFMAVRERFLKSYAASSVAGYVLGIGDRHLDNFLIDMKDGEVLAIDFGIAFGNGIQLTIPELMPFRLTRQVEGVMAPYSHNGIFGATMTYVFRALQEKKEILLDCSEIFVKDPLFDWVKSAKSKLNTAMSMANSSGQREGAESGQEVKEIKWYPRKKMQIMRQKLEGRHPVLVMIDELADSKHGQQAYFPVLKEALTNTTEEIARALKSGVTTLAEPQQVAECLIEMSRNPNILGRTWIGWAPHI